MLRAEVRRSIEREESRRFWERLYPDAGPLRRELYPKHMQFFAEGLTHQERAFVAGNRVGKTTAAGYETMLHLTGLYPAWWAGRRYDKPITAWAAGEDAKTVRESLQIILFGQPGAIGSGILPGDYIIGQTARGGVPEAIDSAAIKHEKGGASRLVLKSYDQGREAFQGAKVEVVWFDEEPPLAVYIEGLTRTMATVPGDPNGSVLCTFTPLKGLSEVVLLYLPGGKAPS